MSELICATFTTRSFKNTLLNWSSFQRGIQVCANNVTLDISGLNITWLMNLSQGGKLSLSAHVHCLFTHIGLSCMLYHQVLVLGHSVFRHFYIACCSSPVVILSIRSCTIDSEVGILEFEIGKFSLFSLRIGEGCFSELEFLNGICFNLLLQLLECAVLSHGFTTLVFVFVDERRRAGKSITSLIHCFCMLVNARLLRTPVHITVRDLRNHLSCRPIPHNRSVTLAATLLNFIRNM